MWSPASMLYTYFVLPSWTLRSPWQQHFRPSIQEYHQNQVQITAANNGIRAIIWAWFSILLSVVTFTKSHTHSACESNVLPGLLTNKGPFKNSSSFLDPTPFILVNSIEFMIMRTAVVNIMLHYIFRLQRTLLPRIQLQEQGVFLSFVPQNFQHLPLSPCPLVLFILRPFIHRALQRTQHVVSSTFLSTPLLQPQNIGFNPAQANLATCSVTFMTLFVLLQNIRVYVLHFHYGLSQMCNVHK